MPPGDSNGWIEHRLLVMDSIRRLQERTSELRVEVQGLRDDLTAQKTKLAIGAAFAGMAASGLVSLAFKLIGS